ncbi:MAG: exosortase/archaeosortase family protein [Verrucomicrobiota bacterium]
MTATAESQHLSFSMRFAFGLALFFVVLVIYDQVFYWSTFEDYSFGYLVPFFAGYVVWDRWPKLKSFLFGTNEGHIDAPITPLMRITEGVMYAGLVVALLFFLLGGLLHASQGISNQASLLMAVGLGGIILGLAFLVAREDTQGKRLSWKERMTFTFLFLFPALVWLVSAPMVMFLDNTVRVVLLEKVTIIVFNLFNFLDLTIIREGNTLILPKGRVGVEDACSGVRSLTGCIFVGAFMSAVFLDKFWKKVLMVLTAMVLAVFTNLIRSLFLTGWAYAYGSEAIDGDIFTNPKELADGTPNPEFFFASVHDIAGYSVMGLTFIFLLILLPLFTFKITPPDDDEEDYEDIEEGAAHPEPTN